ncbi:MAG: DOMON-like domain-containing protein [Cyanobacteria bacterium SBLK]|nr:DOMON-like domain-containing protein [Cyanobacteria bacterium SBLK]
MNKIQVFYLVPFPSGIVDSNLKISVGICRQNNCSLFVDYMAEHIENLAMPPISDKFSRKHELWQETCFEFFLKFPNNSQYWEFNLSPSGDWNTYCFEDYREGMKEEERLTRSSFFIITRANKLSLNTTIDLSAIASPEQVFEMAVSAVTKSKNGDIIYWALTHPEQQADFHHPDSFTVTLD